VPSELGRDLEDRKRIRPSREEAGAAVAVELSGYRNHRVVGGLSADVVELGAVDVRVEVPAALRFAVGSPEQEIVEAFERSGVFGSPRS
jgi:hypothetical protein